MNFIDGIGISMYRGFGKDIVRIGPFSKINLFIGKNDCGKSTVLRFIQSHYKAVVERTAINITEDDLHRGLSPGTPVLEIALKLDGDLFQAFLRSRTINPGNPRVPSAITKFCKGVGIAEKYDTAWFRYSGTGQLGFERDWSNTLYRKRGDSDFAGLHDLLKNPARLCGDNEREVFLNTLRMISPAANTPAPEIQFIEAVRDAKTTGAFDYSGGGLAEKLLELKQPKTNREQDRQKYSKVVSCVRTILNDKDITVEPAFDFSDIYLQYRWKSLPLSHVGTGVHEVLILGMAAAMIENSVVCIEEPELHAHPELQKRLMRYLVNETDNQYFISTHSAHLLDTPGAAVFHVRQENGCIAVDNVTYDKEKADICADLGYRPSDLLQANCIIWVEGPSDKIYLNHWIKAKAKELIEGLHYSIMFYGGNLLAHLTAKDTDDEYVGKFISLCRLNRNMIILIDSDRRDEGDLLKETAERLTNEFREENGLAWVTAGREIENYIKGSELEEAVKSVHPSAKTLAGKGPYMDQTHYRIAGDRKKHTIVKVDVARKISECEEVDWTVLDLNDRVADVVKFIWDANGPEYSPK